MAEKKTPPTERIGVILSADVLAESDRARAELRSKGQRISFSGFVEIALRELCSRGDLASLLRRHGANAKARRD